MADPDYAKALHRKVLILKKQYRYKNAFEICKFTINRFDNEYESEENQKVVPKLKELLELLE